MAQKRGQITVFIIFGIILLIIASLWFYFQSESVSWQGWIDTSIDTPTDMKAVQEYVEECLQKTAEPGAYLLASNGGIFPDDLQDKELNSLSSEYLLTGQRILPYFLVN